MEITQVYYNSADNSSVRVEPQGWSVPQPCNTYHQQIIQEWLSDGNQIEPYDEWCGLSLDDMKFRKRIEMKAERNALLNGVTNITTSQGTYPVDVNQTNRSNMHQAYDNAVLAGIDLTSQTVWKMGDNNHYQIQYAELAEIGLQLGIYISDLYQNEAVKNAQIDACTNRACVESVSWG